MTARYELRADGHRGRRGGGSADGLGPDRHPRPEPPGVVAARGNRALPALGASVVLFVLAAFIEGFISASALPYWAKASVAILQRSLDRGVPIARWSGRKSPPRHGADGHDRAQSCSKPCRPTCVASALRLI